MKTTFKRISLRLTQTESMLLSELSKELQETPTNVLKHALLCFGALNRAVIKEEK